MLKINNLQVYYGDAHALWDINLQVHRGEICTLVGANGGGKTTLLKAVCGLLPVREGSILLMILIYWLSRRKKGSTLDSPCVRKEEKFSPG